VVIDPLVAAMTASGRELSADGASHLERTVLQALAGIGPVVILAATAREPKEIVADRSTCCLLCGGSIVHAAVAACLAGVLI